LLVATSEIAAARAGAEVLGGGGNAVDAAICAAACLTVTEPTSNGLGGDLFALVWDNGRVHGLASSGASPAALDPDAIEGDRVPLYGWIPVTVPGQVAGWAALAGLGRLGLERLLAPAIELAREGFAVGPVTAAAWARAARIYGDAGTPLFAEWRRVFLPGGGAPVAGQRFRNPDLGASLAAIARGGAEAFYRDLGARIAEHARATGGWITEADLLAHRARWEAPLEVGYAGLRVLGMGAPTQGVVALEALAILEGLPGPHSVHDQIEAIKLSFADAYATICDPGVAVARPPADLLAAAHVARRRAALDRERAGPSPAPPAVGLGGTVLVCAGDDEGRVCSLIQSNFHGFGSGIVVPGTGIALQNRGAGFVTTRGHPNRVAGGKRPFHTILPGLIVGPRGVAAFGCMGGQMQPQGHVQLVAAYARGATPQGAVDAPRWRWLDDGQVALELGFDRAEAADLARRGHRVVPDVEAAQFGGAQVVVSTDAGSIGGSDARKDGGVVRS
jgi:gamma-glutamyltranspeptidase / glutathione hydrolase